MPLATRKAQLEPDLTTILASEFSYEIGIVEFCILFSSLANREKQIMLLNVFAMCLI